MANDKLYVLTHWHQIMLENCYRALRGARTGDDHEDAAGSFVVMLCVSLKNSFTTHLEPEWELAWQSNQ